MSDPWRERVEIGDAVLMLGDCREILPTLGSVGAIVTDPPYGMSRHVSGHKVVSRLGKISGDDEPFDPQHLLRDDRHLILWGANHYSALLPSESRWLLWLKHDPVMFGKRSTSPFELAWTNLGGAGRAIKFIWDGSIKQGTGHNREHVHPAEKPIELMEWCLDFTDADSVCDPYMGSGTTGVACIRTGRRFIGIEREAGWFDMACHRIDEAQRNHQGRLFDASKPKAEQLPLIGSDAA